jgi:DNA-binding HxlR family transcriptional regulator
VHAPLALRAAQCRGAIDHQLVLLNNRLKELREARIVEASADGYALTAEGRGLLEALMPLTKWAARWGRSR